MHRLEYLWLTHTLSVIYTGIIIYVWLLKPCIFCSSPYHLASDYSFKGQVELLWVAITDHPGIINYTVVLHGDCSYLLLNFTGSGVLKFKRTFLEEMSQGGVDNSPLTPPLEVHELQGLNLKFCHLTHRKYNYCGLVFCGILTHTTKLIFRI